MEKFRVQADKLKSICPENLFDFKDTSFLDPLDGVVGQQRAVEAIDFGLNMKGLEYNIFVTGLDGTGRSSIVRQLVAAHAANEEPSKDLCMVNNFEDEYCPRVIQMPQGTAVYFSQSMAGFLETLKSRIPEYFETPLFKQEQEKITSRYQGLQKAMFDNVHQKAEQLGLGIQRSENGYIVVPIADEPATVDDALDVSDGTEQLKIEAAAGEVEAQLEEVLNKITISTQEMKSAIKDLVAAKTDDLISRQIDPIRYYFRDSDGVQVYLKQVKEDLIDNIAMFLGIQKSNDPKQEDGFSKMANTMVRRYQVNVLVDRRREKGAPVVFEPNPSFGNLFGKIEKKPVMGSFATDFTMVQAGSLLRANGGYIVINIDPLLQNPTVWEALKRTLQQSQLQIEDMPDHADYGMPSLKPAPIPLKVKVILIGGYDPFRALQGMDSQFNKIFRVRADFDYEIQRNDENANNYARFVARVCQQDDLRPFSPDGVWQIVKYASRLVEDRERLSLQFGRVRGLIMEADFWAQKDGAAVVVRDHVRSAMQHYRLRHNLYEDKVLSQFDDDSVLLSVTGRVTGQVNALAVYDMGEIAFGRPTRITAESYMGTPGIINVERESELSGQTHDKGMMIISGYLGRMFAQRFPLSVSISITFEQSYDGVDGDSASSTELYAVLSSLSGIPIRQAVAVTGSVNQKGEIQAIGGVNEKIEGFFEICARKGLTGTQGVMIPASNVKNLVLRDAVITAIIEKKFHLYSVKTIEQGIEVLTGIRAGKPGKNGAYPKDSVFGKVQQKLARYHQLSGPVSQ